MPVPFTPRDLNSIIWYTAANRYVTFHPGSTSRVSNLESVTNGDWPLTGFNHGEPQFADLYRSPLLTALGDNALNGRSTLYFPQGSYLKGATRAWTGNWNTPQPGSPWDYNSNPEGEATYSYGATERYIDQAWPPDQQSGFVLLRATPPTIDPADSFWSTGGNTGIEDVNGNQRPSRPCLFGSKFGDAVFTVGSYPGCRILSWDPSNPTAAGTLEFYGDARAFCEPRRLNDRTASATNFAAVVPFDKFGKWVLIDWRKTYTGTPNNINYAGLTTFYINGVEVAQIDSPYGDVETGPDFHLFGSSINTGGFGDTRTMTAFGNVAEVVLIPTALSDDDTAKARAYICRKWGLQTILRGQPYASAPFIPGTDPQLDWAFPGIRPSSRTYTPGSYANTPFESIGGVEQRVRHSSTNFAGDRLSLTYNALSEAEVGRFLDHYENRQGGFRTFGLHPESLINLGPVARHLNRERSRAEYAPRNSSWAYVSEPVVQNRQLNLNALTLELELQAEPFFVEFPPSAVETTFSSQMELSYERLFGGAGTLSINTAGQLLYKAFIGDPEVVITSDATLLINRALDGVATIEFANPSILMTVYFDGEPGTIEFAATSELVYVPTALTARWEFDGTLDFTYEGGLTAPVAIEGNPVFDPTIKVFGSSSAYFDGNYDIPVPEFAEYLLPQSYGLEDFCVQCFLRVPASLVSAGGYVTAVAFGGKCSIDFDGTGPTFGLYVPGFPFNSIPAAADTWHHVAAYRVDGVFYLAVGGIVIESFTGTFNFEGLADGRQFIVGDWVGDGEYSYLGWVDRLIVEFGSSPYGPDNFTPPA